MGTKKSRTKTEHQQRVEDFMRKAKQVLPKKPTMPDAETRLLRARLIFEEAMETLEALGVDVMVPLMYGQTGPVALHDYFLRINDFRRPNMDGIVDGCADISVVTIGTLSA